MTEGALPVLLRRSVGQVRHLRPVRPRHATGLVAEVYRQLEAEFGMLAPPVALHAPEPTLLAASWLMLRETLIADGPLSRPDREAVAAAVSRSNDCPYCATVHDLARTALPAGEADGVGRLVDWVLRGGDAAGAAAPVPAAAARQALGVAATFQYLNRMVNVFLPESPLPARLPVTLRGSADRMLQRLLADRAGLPHPAGASLGLRPPTEPAMEPGDPIGEAFRRATAAVERVRQRWVPPAVAELLPDLLTRWDGTPPPLAGGWLTEALASLPIADRAAGRLALLTAFASYRVTDRVVADFRRHLPADEALLGTVSWASLAAARRFDCRAC